MARLIFISVLYCLICCCSSQISDSEVEETVVTDEIVTFNVDELEAPPPGVSIEGLGPEVPSPTPELQGVQEVKEEPLTLQQSPRPLDDEIRHPPPLPVLPNCYDPNEIVRCVQKCPPERTCRNRNKLYRCPRIKDRCTRKCVCKPGYFRNAIGQCITEAQCNLCSKPHEYYSCGVACDNVCSTIKFANQTNCPIKNIRCNERCYCQSDYARDVKGNCIPISKCPPSCDSPYEEYVRSRSCPPDTCLSLVARFKCNSKEKPKYRCRCKSGYLRPNAGAPCVPICQCPQMANSPDCADSLLT